MKSVRYVMTSLMILLSFSCIAQLEKAVWAFGFNGGVDFTTPTPTVFASALGHIEGCASIADKNGDLLFYTDGDRIYNRNHQMMQNGVLFFGQPYPLFGAGPIYSATQSTLIVKVPNDSLKYYVFSLGNADYGYLWYSIVDMSLDNGLGAVVNNRKNVLLNGSGELSEKMTAVAGNACNAWVVIHNAITNKFLSYEIKNNGIATSPVESDAVFPTSKIGVIKFSNNRLKMGSASFGGADVGYDKGLSLYDFNPNNGMISNAINIDNNDSYYGLCFSPDDTKVYTSTISQVGNSVSNANLYQFDLNQPSTPTILASKFWLASTLSDLKLGPDGKIYFGATYGQLGAVNFPNNAGAASQVVTNAIDISTVGGYVYYGLPNDVITVVDNAEASTENVITCFKDSVMVAANPLGFNYYWNDGVTTQNRIINFSGTYYVTYNTGCKLLTDTFKVLLHKLPTLTVDTSCINTPVGKASAIARDNSMFSYKWKNSNGIEIQTQVSNNGHAIHGLYPGNYEVQISTESGCDTTLQFTIDAYPVSTLTVNPSSATIKYGDSITLNVSGSMNYIWFPPTNIDDVYSESPNVFPKVPTQYLVVSNDTNGCKDSAVVNIDIDFSTNHVIPNAFSPNGDGLNDVFKIVNLKFEKLLQFRIFDRYGQIVFETLSHNLGWDGSYSGKPADVGVYYYVISVAMPDGSVKHYKGDVTLIR